MNLQIWGDSIMRGLIYDEIKDRYRILMEGAGAGLSKLGIKVNNRAKVGMTSPEGQKILIEDIENGKCSCEVALIEFGGNDSDFNWKAISEEPSGNHLPKTPMVEFTNSMKDMIFRVRANGMKPILMTLPPLDEEKYFEHVTSDGKDKNNVLKWLGELKTIYSFHEGYSDAIVKISQEFKCVLIDVRSAFLSKDNYKNYLCRDGIHPNAEGYKIIHDTFLKNSNLILA